MSKGKYIKRMPPKQCMNNIENHVDICYSILGRIKRKIAKNITEEMQRDFEVLDQYYKSLKEEWKEQGNIVK